MSALSSLATAMQLSVEILMKAMIVSAVLVTWFNGSMVHPVKVN